MATRTAAPARAGSGGAGAGARPADASAPSCSSRAATSASSAPPTTAAPRNGAFGPAGVLAAEVTVGEPAAIVAPAYDRDASGGRCRPGRYSSMTAWKLVPPNPKALTPAQRTPLSGAGHSRSSVFTRNGMSSQSTFGLGWSKCRLGVSTFSWRLSTVLNRPAAPAAPLRWPILDLTDPSAIEPFAAPALRNTSVKLASSVASPTRVEVPCASMQVARAGSTPATCHARSTANRCPIGLGAVMPLPRPSLAPARPSSTA